MDGPGKSLASPPDGPGWRNALGWVAVGLGLAVQYGLLYQFARRELVWAFPILCDQVCYLLSSYTTFDAILRHGLAAGLWHGWKLAHPHGVLLHLQAALLYLVMGPGRVSALTLNFLHFAVLQLALVGTLRWLAGRWSVALLGLGLLLSAGCPFVLAGGIADFRIDFIAWCLYGTLLCAVVRSNVFASLRWSAAVGAAVWLVLFRLVAVGHLAAVAAVLLPVLAARGDDYCITLELPSGESLPEEAPVEVRLKFDTYIEPKDHGWPNDPRHLVIFKPESTALVR